MRDLSLAGFSATAMSAIPPRTMCWLTFPESEPRQAKVVWWENGVVGCAFEQLLEQPELEAMLARWNGDGRLR